ncbi:aminopeptidase [Paenibacillus massiliensis]|uniref:aminopeptidase n=1 Tax=Paenibacillus massiliensis TaxID=225917 RepID=UPI0003617D52|nr:aminopeptidase [Paenibacillus massiliensis]
MSSAVLSHMARHIMENALALCKGERVLIEVIGEAQELTEALIHAAYEIGAEPFVSYMPVRLLKRIIYESTPEQLEFWKDTDLRRLQSMDAYIGLKSEANMYEMSDIPVDRYERYVQGYLQPLQYAMADKGRWMLLRNPTPGMAQLAKMSEDECQQIYYKACGLNYTRLSELSAPLAARLEQADRVQITGPGTDLTFSIRGMGRFIGAGQYNLPDGELFTAPILDSAEGVISFNLPATYMGIVFEQVRLEFQQGIVTKATCAGLRTSERLQSLLHSDEGASRIGEFGMGLNPHIRTAMGNVLFDEKMAGSLHLALGQAYPMADNGNHSSIHWDLVLSQAAKDGGGELYLDGELIRRDGLFVPKDLQPLDQWQGG